MIRYQAIYMHMETSVFARSKEDARIEAAKAFNIRSEFTNRIAVVPTMPDGRVY